MPKCINDPKKSYKGNEPSPKGIGYCAHSEIVGTIRKGLDGNKWIISKTSKNIKRWIKYKDVKENNKSPEELYKIIKKKYIGYKTYFTHYNGGRPYLVYIKKNDVNIYSSLDNIDASLCSNNDNENKWVYVNFVQHFTAKKVFIGESPLIRMTNYSGGHGKQYDGNTILIYMGSNNYIRISNIIEKIYINDEIEKYYSFIGNSDVPYPMAIGKKNIYFFLFPEGYLPKNEFSINKKFNKENLQYIVDKGYELFPFLIPYDNKKKKYDISLEEFKKIKEKSINEISLDTVKKLAKMYIATTIGTKQELLDKIEYHHGITVYKK